jgi:hypothetical protein
MAVQTISTTSDIPKVLDPYYIGRPAEGTKPEIVGLLERGMGQIFPEGLTGAQAYAHNLRL